MALHVVHASSLMLRKSLADDADGSRGRDGSNRSADHIALCKAIGDFSARRVTASTQPLRRICASGEE
jgi:hypothetical protein